MGLYDPSGALNAAVNDTTGVGRYSASGALRITIVTGNSYVGLYASDGSMNVVLDSVGQGLYHPSGAIRGVSALSTYTGVYAPNGGIYLSGLTPSAGNFFIWGTGNNLTWGTDNLIWGT